MAKQGKGLGLIRKSDYGWDQGPGFALKRWGIVFWDMRYLMLRSNLPQHHRQPPIGLSGVTSETSALRVLGLSARTRALGPDLIPDHPK